MQTCKKCKKLRAKTMVCSCCGECIECERDHFERQNPGVGLNTGRCAVKTYRTVRFYEKGRREVLETGLSLEDALEICLDPETSSKTCKLPESIRWTEEYGPWFVEYEEESKP